MPHPFTVLFCLLLSSSSFFNLLLVGPAMGDMYARACMGAGRGLGGEWSEEIPLPRNAHGGQRTTLELVLSVPTF